MVHAEESVVIHRACRDLFALVTDLQKMPLWRANVAVAEWRGDQEPGIGPSRIRAVTQLLGLRLEWDCDVTAWEPPHRFAYVAAGSGTSVSVEFRCEATAEGCRLTMTGGGDVPGGRIGAVAAPLYVKALLRENRRSLRALKMLAEAVPDADGGAAR